MPRENRDDVRIVRASHPRIVATLPGVSSDGHAESQPSTRGGCSMLRGRIVVLNRPRRLGGDVVADAASDRERLRMTFDQAADLYEHARPDYPDELFDRLLEVTGLERGARLLEVGCATGKATLPLAARGMRITCIELGPALAAVARSRLEAFSDVEVIEGAFEDWDAPADAYDLVFAATAWQWVDPAVRYQRAARALRSRGFLAFWDATHVFPAGGDPFFDDIQDVYDEIGEQLPPGASRPAPGELADHRAEIEASGLFEVVDVHHLDWEITYDATSYVDLLDTFSSHITMEDWQRQRLYSEIRQRLEARPDRRLRRGWGAVLHIAQRTR